MCAPSVLSHSNATNPKSGFQLPCQYSQKSRSFSCLVEILEGDRNYHVVSLCVANSVGSKSSSNVAFHSLKIGKQVPSPQLLLSTSGRGREGVQRGLGTGSLGALLTNGWGLLRVNIGVIR